MKKLVKDLPGFPKEKEVHSKYCSWGLGTSGCSCGVHGFNEARSLIGNLQQELEPLDEKEVTFFVYTLLAPGLFEEYGFIQHFGDCPNDEGCRAEGIARKICQRFGTSAVGTGKQAPANHGNLQQELEALDEKEFIDFMMKYNLTMQLSGYFRITELKNWHEIEYPKFLKFIFGYISMKFGTQAPVKHKCQICDNEAVVDQKENGWRCFNHALIGTSAVGTENMKENKFSAKALMLCPICKNSYYSELGVTVPENFRDMKEINTAKDNNGDIVHLDICSSAAPIKKEPCHICEARSLIGNLQQELEAIDKDKMIKAIEIIEAEIGYRFKNDHPCLGQWKNHPEDIIYFKASLLCQRFGTSAVKEQKLFDEIIELKKDKRDLESHLDSLRLEIEGLKKVSATENFNNSNFSAMAEETDLGTSAVGKGDI